MKKKNIVFLLIVSLIAVVIYLNASFIRATDEFAKTDASNIVTRAVNESVLDVLNKKNIEYNDVSTVVFDENGKIRSVKINTMSVNLIKSELTVAVMNTLCDIENSVFGVNIGNIIGSRLLSGRGAKVKIKIVPLGTVATEIKNTFVSAGINQTNHRIELIIKASATVVSPFSDASLEVSTSVCIAETIIVGDIPDTYLDFTPSR